MSKVKRKKSTGHWEVQTYTLFDGWVNCWHHECKPWTFRTRQAAQKELDIYVKDVHEAVVAGDMFEEVDLADHRIMYINFNK